jgi:predicted dehydrogenase
MESRVVIAYHPAMVKTLIVGLRNRGAAWARAVNAHPGFVIAGIADVDAGVLESRGAELGIAAEARHAGIGEALATGRYEAAIVVVPNHLHYPVAKTVIEAGVPCLLEKPFTEEIPHAEELVALAASRHVPLVIGQNYRYKPQFRIAAERLASGTLGRLGAIHAVFHRSRPPRHEHERPMRFPLLYLQGIHHLDWILSVLPAPITELHVEHRLPPWSPWSSPSICVLSARCADGVLVSYDASYECHGEQTPYNGLWRLECEGGDLVMDAEQRLWRTDASGRTLLHEPQDSDMVASDGGLLDALAAMMGGGPEAPTSGRNNLATLRLLFEVIGSGAAW